MYVCMHCKGTYCKPSRLRDILGKRFWVLGESPPLATPLGALSADLAPLRRVDDQIFNCISVLSTHPTQLIESIRVDSEFRHWPSDGAVSHGFRMDASSQFPA